MTLWRDSTPVSADPSEVRFTVRGIPVAQGSARAFVTNGRARIVSDASRPNSPLGAWRGSIASEARSAMQGLPSFGGPLHVRAQFVLARPKSHFRADRVSLVARAARYPRLDIDKLARALLDGMTGVVFDDDSQVVWLSAEKSWDDDVRGWQGVEVTVSEVRGEQL